MVIHPLVYVAARQPQLLAEHAKAYGDLILEESRRTLTSLALHAALYAGAAVLGLLSLAFGGFSLLLYAAIAGPMRESWLLIALPGSSLLGATVCIVLVRLLPINVTLGVVGQQLKADINMIHEAAQS